jgi:hypothetical protein
MSRGSGIRFLQKMGTPTQSAQYYVWSQPPEGVTTSGIINQNSNFAEPAGEGWTEEETGDNSGSVDYTTIGFAIFASTLLGGIYINQSIMSIGNTYRVEIDVSNYVAGSLTIKNDTDEIDCGITETGTFVIEFVAKSALFSIGLLLGSIQALTCSGIRLYRIL